MNESYSKLSSVTADLKIVWKLVLLAWLSVLLQGRERVAASGWQLNKLNNRKYSEGVEVLLLKFIAVFKIQYRNLDLNSWKYVIWISKILRANNFRTYFQNQCEDWLFFFPSHRQCHFSFQICSAPAIDRLFNICQILQSTFKYQKNPVKCRNC